MRHFSLSQRVKLTFIACFMVLSVISIMLIYATLKILQDHIFETQLKRQVTQYLAQQHNQVPYSLPASFSHYQSFADLPANIKPHIDQQTIGFDELNLPNELDYHYGIVESDTGEKQYFIYEVNNIELADEVEFEVFKHITLGFIILLSALFVVFRLVLNRSLRPMHELITQVKQQAEAPQSPIRYQHPQDNELGLLNETITAYSERIEAFIKREQEFTSFASHELRTPVTVIKGAAELLQLQMQNQQVHNKPLVRIQRAVQSMEDMIDLLLSLSREQGRTQSQTQSLNGIFIRVCSNLESQLNSKNKKLHISGALDITENTESIPAEIVITNLMRNAIEHSSDDQIKIAIESRTLTISNRKDAIPIQQHNNYGLGLTIVERICQQQGWHLRKHLAENLFEITIFFDLSASNSD